MEAQIRVQDELYDRLAKNRINFKKAPKDRITETYVKVRVQNVEEIWQALTTNHSKIVSTYDMSLIMQTSYFKNDTYDLAQELYLDHKTELLSILESLSKTETGSADRSHTLPATEIKSQIKLPKIVVPTFSGKYTEWLTFRDLFKSLIHNNPAIDNVQKLHYLKGYLTGEAEQLIRNITIEEANYIRCWEELEERYDNKKFLAHHTLKRLFSQRNIQSESAAAIKELVDTTNDCLCTLQNIGVDIKSWDIIIIHILTLKLDPETRREWELQVVEDSCTDELPTYKRFKEFLTNRFRALEFLPQAHKARTIPSFSNSNHNRVLHAVHLSCGYCKDPHKLSECKKFGRETVALRRQYIQDNGRCFICLEGNHSAKRCKSFTPCNICKKRKHHHTLLHVSSDNQCDSNKKGSTSKSKEEEEPGDLVSNTALVGCATGQVARGQVLLATAVVNAVGRNQINCPIRALIDQGSQASFITENIVQLLKLKKIPTKSTISGIGGGGVMPSNAVVSVKLISRIDPTVELEVHAYVLKSITTVLPSKFVEPIKWNELNHLELADPDFNIPNKIDILLGADIYGNIIKEGMVKGPSGSPVAQCTVFGWIVSGTVRNAKSDSSSIKIVTHHCAVEDEMLKKFWELEEGFPMIKKHTMTAEEACCEDIFRSTTVRDETGRYVVKLPFKNEDPECKRGQFLQVAEKRFKALEVKFQKDPTFKQRYKEVIDEYLSLNHMELVEDNDEKRHESVYLPHHAVIREQKDTTKLRVVFDASCKGKNGKSLNDDLLVGPALQPELRKLLLQWRKNPICLIADIEKMYRQVKVHRQDCDFQRILWRESPDEAIKHYRLMRVTFGTASAPYLAVRVMQQVAEDEGRLLNKDQMEEPEGEVINPSEIIKNQFYMDDLLTNCETVEGGVRIYKQLNEILGKGGFKIQKWTTNNEELLERMKNFNEGESVTEEFKIKSDNVMKVVGITWNRSEDAFRYTVTLPELEPPVSKRRIISDISRFYDPLGWASPSTVISKMFIQKLWLLGIGWDEAVPINLLNQWINYRKELTVLSEIKIPRWVKTKSDNLEVELHGFCDASKEAYGAAVYIRVIDSDGKVHVSLIAAKTKVAPVKQVSIPRLELCGAVLLTKFLLEISKVLKIDITHLHAWTDSQVVLAWLNSHPSRWKTFVANRVSEIITQLDPSHWCHVSSKENPADFASRGLKPTALKEQTMWFKGPPFLHLQPITYKRSKNTETSLEIAKTVNLATTENFIWENYSSLTKLIRVVAYCLRFIRNSRGSQNYKDYLTVDELQEALKVCLRQFQLQDFNEELEILRDNKRKKSLKAPLKSLNPIIDSDGLLRVGGRLDQSDLNVNRKHPVILSKTSHLTSLIIKDAHKRTLHGGPQAMLHFLQAKYWIIGAKQLAKAFVHKCTICVKAKANSNTPIMGQLPPARVTPSRPFLKSGLDYAGPILIRTTKGRGHRAYKGYICLFVCMATRAIHLEAVSDLTAEGFLQAFKRFVARRGLCAEIFSDNGTNFVGAAAELKKLFNQQGKGVMQEVAEALAVDGCKWHWIPPHSPNFGGLWEAGIRSVKHHLKRVIGSSTLTYEEMSTVLAQIEACLNSRPQYVISDIDSILTPGHFLIGESLIAVPDKNYLDANVSSLRRWQYSQKLVQGFWDAWHKDYLNKFYHRYRNSDIGPVINVNDVVVVKEDNLPPTRWLLGKVISTHAGKDNIIRVVSLKTKNGTIKRPVSKLCILPVTD